MSKCEFVYETDPLDTRLTGGMGGLVTLRCKTHNSTIVVDHQSCVIGRIETLEERVAQLERPQSNIPTDELGNPFSLRRQTKLEGG
jgi:hypothetical protein